LAGPERREPDEKVDHADADVGRSRRLAVALDEVRLPWRGPRERSPAEQVVHERADVRPEPTPPRLTAGFGHRPPCPAGPALLDEQCGAPYRQVLPLGGHLVCAGEGAGAPHHVAVDRKAPQTVES